MIDNLIKRLLKFVRSVAEMWYRETAVSAHEDGNGTPKTAVLPHGSKWTMNNSGGWKM